MIMTRHRYLVALLALFATACLPGEELETRTFELEHLEPGEAVGLLEPYVYPDREGAEGMLSTTQRTVTVRELPENVERIAAVLEEFDRQPPGVRLNFKVIEANGYAGADAAIADIEAELRKLFNFDGYRLAAQTVLPIVERGDLDQTVGELGYHIEGTVWDVTVKDGAGSVMMAIGLEGLFRTTVTIPIGETVVLGSGRVIGLDDDVRAAILVVEPELMAGSRE